MEFVVNALPVELIGMNSTMMCNYIMFYADWFLIAIGPCRHYKIGNPFEWMEMISLQGKRFFRKTLWRIGIQNPEWEWTELTDEFTPLPA